MCKKIGQNKRHRWPFLISPGMLAPKNVREEREGLVGLSGDRSYATVTIYMIKSMTAKMKTQCLMLKFGRRHSSNLDPAGGLSPDVKGNSEGEGRGPRAVEGCSRFLSSLEKSAKVWMRAILEISQNGKGRRPRVVQIRKTRKSFFGLSRRL